MSRRRSTPVRSPDVCPVCGEDVPHGALACPECGADHNSGWHKDAGSYDGVGLPEDDFDYDEFVRQEFESSSKPAALRTLWWVTGILVIVVLVAIYFYPALR